MTETDRPKRIAVVLAGAVAKGAFEAGALKVLVERNVEIVRIVAASSGALNGTVLAAGLRKGDARRAMVDLWELWLEHAHLTRGFNVKLGSALLLGGVSGPEKLLALLEERVKPCAVPPDARRPIDLRIVVSPLDGDVMKIDDEAATTYEKVLTFRDEVFDELGTLRDVFQAAAASSAFPFVFVPVPIENLALYSEEGTRKEGVGPFIDGGTVNNTPIKYALGGWGEGTLGTTPDAVVVISPTPQLEREVDRPGTRRGVPLLERLVDMLINERLNRDLHDAEDVNTALAKLEELKAKRALTEEQYQEVLAALDWGKRKQVKIVSIRPERALEGNPFSALVLGRSKREAYLKEGAACAVKALDGLQWQPVRPAAATTAGADRGTPGA